MQFHENRFYHIYNRGNDRQLIFFQLRNYFYFLNKMKHFLEPHCDILAYCLMPTHFHLLVHTRGLTGQTVGNRQTGMVRSIASLLSSYSQGVNKQERRTGGVFQKKTKAKLIESSDYLNTCFHYIHQNPVKAKLATRPEEWSFSSYAAYAGLSDNIYCNVEAGYVFTGLKKSDFTEYSHNKFNPGESK